MKILLTGGNGQVGWELQKTLANLGDVIVLGREQLDLSQPKTLREVILNVEPKWIVNAGAHTAVDKAEQEPGLAFRVNAEAPRILAETSAELDIKLIHYSTDYVFDGTGHLPFREEAPIGPLNVYGASKAAGEAAIRAAHEKHLIFRTSWVYGHRDTNFFLTMQRLMSEKNELRIVNDQIGAPTWSRHIAEMTAHIMMQMNASSLTSDHSQLWGTYHLTSGGETSWYGFAEEILKALTLNNKPNLIPIPSNEYLLPATRPLNSRLSNEKLQRMFGIKLPDWKITFNEMVAQRCV